MTIFSLPIKLNYVTFLSLEEPTIFAVVLYLTVTLRRAKLSMLIRVFVVTNPNFWAYTEVSVFYVSIYYFCIFSTR